MDLTAFYKMFQKVQSELFIFVHDVPTDQIFHKSISISEMTQSKIQKT